MGGGSHRPGCYASRNDRRTCTVCINGVSCKLCIHGPGSSNGSIPGLVGKISADPNTVRNVTSESMDNSCIMA